MQYFNEHMHVYLLEYFSRPWAVYSVMIREFGHWTCGESWLAIKDLQPTAPVLKAGHPVSCSSLCVLCVVCLVCIVWFVEVRFLGFSLLLLC